MEKLEAAPGTNQQAKTEISSKVERLNAKLAEFRGIYSTGETVAITLGLAPIETECFRLWAMVLYQEGRQMIVNGRGFPDLTRVQAAAKGLLEAMAREHTREMIIYPPEIDEFMDAVKASRWNSLPVDQELIGQEIAVQKAGRERKGSSSASATAKRAGAFPG
jgi:ribosomal protein S19